VSERDSAARAREQEPERVVVRDRRRIDPLTGQVRTPEGSPSGAEAAPAGGGPTGGDPANPSDTEVETPVEAHSYVDTATPDPADTKLAELAAQLDERTADLQRVSAEYANYRRRTDRDREAVVLTAKAQVAADLLTVLDDIARAQAHGDLTGAFKSVADKLVSSLTRAGLTSFGEEGDPFDPSVHEAVQHTTSADVAGPTVTLVMRQGYRMGERVLRPAMVAVTDADAGAPDPPSDLGARPGPAGPAGSGGDVGDGAGAAHEHD
jgi:molecular chaperone GrpE